MALNPFGSEGGYVLTNGTVIKDGTIDPSVSGLDLPLGSWYFKTSSPVGAYQKTGSGNTDWIKTPQTSGGVSPTVTTYDNSSGTSTSLNNSGLFDITLSIEDRSQSSDFTVNLPTSNVNQGSKITIADTAQLNSIQKIIINPGTINIDGNTDSINLIHTGATVTLMNVASSGIEWKIVRTAFYRHHFHQAFFQQQSSWGYNQYFDIFPINTPSGQNSGYEGATTWRPMQNISNFKLIQQNFLCSAMNFQQWYSTSESRFATFSLIEHQKSSFSTLASWNVNFGSYPASYYGSEVKIEIPLDGQGIVLNDNSLYSLRFDPYSNTAFAISSFDYPYTVLRFEEIK